MPACHTITSPMSRAFAAGLFASTLLLAGCGDSSHSGPAAAAPPGAASEQNREHAHSAHGPHHGDLVELGNEDYHAEIVHSEGGEVTVYILDRSASQAVPIDAPDVTINVSHQEEAAQFTLRAAPEAGDGAGKSSRFTVQDAHLAEDLAAAGTSAKLVVTINGKQYTGKIKPAHGHAGHEHK